MLRRYAAALVVVAVVAVGACRSNKDAAPPSYITEEAMLTMTVKVRGDLQVDFDEKVQARYTAIRSTGSGSSVEILGVRPSDALRAGRDAIVPGMSVAPYKGDGTYVVERTPETKPGEPAPPPSGAKSGVTLVWYADGNLEGDPVEFSRHLENCVIKIDKDGTTGHAKCPKTSTPRGDKTISLEFKWKAPKFEAHDRVTVPPDPSTSSSTP